MGDKALHKEFKKTFKKVSETSQEFPPDVLLKFYALYKQATQKKNLNNSYGEHELVSAFKLNALFQVKHLTEDEAKEEYIKVAKVYLK